jgi:hypothetical protein
LRRTCSSSATPVIHGVLTAVTGAGLAADDTRLTGKDRLQRRGRRTRSRRGSARPGVPPPDPLAAGALWSGNDSESLAPYGLPGDCPEMGPIGAVDTTGWEVSSVRSAQSRGRVRQTQRPSSDEAVPPSPHSLPGLNDLRPGVIHAWRQMRAFRASWHRRIYE